jgi:hypothetical protein
MLKVAALLAGEPGPLELWTLRAIHSSGCGLAVVQARKGVPRRRRFMAMLRRLGLRRALSRMAGSLVAAFVARQEQVLLEELCDMEDLRAWRRGAGLRWEKIRGFHEPEALTALSDLAPDIVVRVSGGVLDPKLLCKARVAALNVHHGVSPLIRGMWSIPWGIVDGRADWIGATVHLMDEGIDTGGVLWRGSPQLAPGDTSVDLLFRAHLQAVAALASLLGRYACGEPPSPLRRSPEEQSIYRSAAGLGDWIRFLRLGKGRQAPVLIERALR